MNGGDATDALEQALALHAAPTRASLARARALPANVLWLIRIAAGDAARIDAAARRTGKSAEVVTDASRLYLQHILFAESADSYRTLGVRADDDDETIRTHYRSLVSWLHPDRNADQWDAVFAERVNRAWKTINTSERRVQYDAWLRQQATPVPAGGVRLGVRGVAVNIDARELRLRAAGRGWRWVPATLLAMLSVATLAVLWALNGPRQGAPGSGETTPASSDTASKAVADSAIVASGAVASQSRDEASVGEAAAAPPAAAPSADTVLPVATEQATAGSDDAMASPGQTNTLPSAVQAGGAADESPAPATVQMQVHPAMVPGIRQPDVRQSSRVGSPFQAAVKPVAAGKVAPDEAAGRRTELAAAQSPHGRIGAVPPTVASPVVKDAARTVAVADANRLRRAAPITATGEPARPTEVARPVQTSRRADPGSSPMDGAIAVTRTFVAAYAAGDLHGLMRLFTPTASNDRGGIDAIEQDYAGFFRQSRYRSLHWQPITWAVNADRAVGTGPFVARIAGQGDWMAHDVHGWMRMEVVRYEGEWKIQHLQHGNAE
ncbi:MAG: DnaJ domain-containing protein [Proteobacteria bacterium]|nr:DnaJ domain-containing protein [Pseudomonadota bacterium]